MATALQVLKSALQRILVQGSEADFEPDEYQDAIFAMNNYMFGLDADGVSLGYTRVHDLGDTVTVPTGALRGLIANVAIEISPDYGGKVTPALLRAAAEGESLMRKLGQRVPTSEYPGNLPYGIAQSGDALDFVNYYPDLEARILAETTGAVGLETGTNDAA